jgi:hypothetical protein
VWWILYRAGGVKGGQCEGWILYRAGGVKGLMLRNPEHGTFTVGDDTFNTCGNVRAGSSTFCPHSGFMCFVWI